jgi:DNA-binding MarR family transcriptional regulator
MSGLERLGPVSAGELAAAERLPQPTLSRLLDDLEARGWCGAARTRMTGGAPWSK